MVGNGVRSPKWLRSGVFRRSYRLIEMYLGITESGALVFAGGIEASMLG